MAIIIILSFYFFLTSSFASTNTFFFSILNQMTRNDSSLYAVSSQKLSKKKLHQLAKFKFLPTLNISANDSRNLTLTKSSKNLIIGSSLNIFNGGQDLFNLQSSKINFDLAKTNLISQTIKSEIRMSQLIFNLINAQEIELIYNKLLKIEQQSHMTALHLYKNGQISQEKLMQANIDLQLASNNYEAQSVNLYNAKEKTSAYLNTAVHSKLTWPWKLKEIETRIVKKLKLEQLPQVQSSILKLNVLKKDRLKLNSNYFPKANLSLTRNTDLKSVRLNQDVNLSINLTWSIFNQTIDSTNIYLQELEINNQHARIDEIKRNTKSNLHYLSKQLKLNILTLKNNIKTQQLTQILYKKNYSRYLQGHISTNDFKMDKTRLLESLINVNKGLYNLHVNMVKLCEQEGLLLRRCI